MVEVGGVNIRFVEKERMTDIVDSVARNLNALTSATIAGANCLILLLIFLALGSCALCCLITLVIGAGA